MSARGRSFIYEMGVCDVLLHITDIQPMQLLHRPNQGPALEPGQFIRKLWFMTKLSELRCPYCYKLLCRFSGAVEVKCPRCKSIIERRTNRAPRVPGA